MVEDELVGYAVHRLDPSKVRGEVVLWGTMPKATYD